MFSEYNIKTAIIATIAAIITMSCSSNVVPQKQSTELIQDSQVNNKTQILDEATSLTNMGNCQSHCYVKNYIQKSSQISQKSESNQSLTPTTSSSQSQSARASNSSLTWWVMGIILIIVLMGLTWIFKNRK